MTRTYTKAKRAENEAETRRRIIEATVGLHGEIGPARTTISMIADRAGVQRHTVYAHFPDDRSLHMACSGHHMELNPLPSPDDWAADNDPDVRLHKALAALYGWYAANARLMSNVMRDYEVHAMTREVTDLRAGPGLHAIAESVSGGLGTMGRAALTLAMNFFTWRTLAQEARLSPETAVDLMTRMVRDADRQQA